MINRIVYVCIFICGCRYNNDPIIDNSTIVPPAIINGDYDASTIKDGGIDNIGISDADADADAVACGSPGLKCEIGETCKTNSDCISFACDYNKRCIADKSCVNHFGGDTCGNGEVGLAGATHETCCKSIPVSGLIDASHPNKTIYLDKYEITAGRMRAFIDAVILEMGKPDFKGWVARHRPDTWNDSWTQFLPSDYEGDRLLISRYLLGDPRHLGQTQEEAGPGIILCPATDQLVSTGLNHQFSGSVFAETHGGNCGTFAGAWGFPTYWYDDSILITDGEIPRVNPVDSNGKSINAKDALDVKSMNCATNLMFQLFCSFDGGQLQTNETFDFITDSPPNRPIYVSGCGSQFSNHGDLLGDIRSSSVFTGGRCANAYGGGVNLFFDAGQNLPIPGSSLNYNVYNYPNYGNSPNDKAWVVASPGRMSLDVVRIHPNDEGWKDMAGNLTETVLETSNGVFGGLFSLRGQGIGFGSQRSDMIVYPLNIAGDIPDQGILRGQRPEVKSALVGARCQYYK